MSRLRNSVAVLAMLVGIIGVAVVIAAGEQPAALSMGTLAFKFYDFTDESMVVNPTFHFNCNVTRKSPVALLTPAHTGAQGSMYTNARLDLERTPCFSAFFKVHIGNCSSMCADGFAFNLQTFAPTYVGKGGSNLGILDDYSPYIRFVSVAVRSYAYRDIALFNEVNQNYNKPLQTTSAVAASFDNLTVRVWVNYVGGPGGTLYVYYSTTSDTRPVTPALTAFNLFSAPVQGGYLYHVGMSGATGLGYQLSRLLEAEFASCGPDEFVGGVCQPACRAQEPGGTCLACPASSGPGAVGKDCTVCKSYNFQSGSGCRPCSECVNGGTCIKGQCLCPGGTYGPLCTSCSLCNGFCHSGYAGNCTCSPGYAASPACDECATGHFGLMCLPCSVCNGECTSGRAGGCVCAAGRIGPPVCNECAANYYGPACRWCGDCAKHGTCVAGPSGYCRCDAGWSGDACDTVSGWVWAVATLGIAVLVLLAGVATWCLCSRYGPSHTRLAARAKDSYALLDRSTERDVALSFGTDDAVDASDAQLEPANQEETHV